MMTSAPQPPPQPGPQRSCVGEALEMGTVLEALGRWTKGEMDAQQLRAATKERW